MAKHSRGRHRASAPSVAFFFGAGAEVPYGMPVGGRFALEILRAGKPDAQFRADRKRISENCKPAYRRWLPTKFATDSVYGLTSNEHRAVFEDSLRNGYRRVIASLDKFDEVAQSLLAREGIAESAASAVFNAVSGGLEFGALPYSGVKLHASIGSVHPPLFSSKYFSALMMLAKSGTQREAMTRLARSTIQFYLGAHGTSAMEAMTLDPLVNIPDDNPAFSELPNVQRESHRCGNRRLQGGHGPSTRDRMERRFHFLGFGSPSAGKCGRAIYRLSNDDG